MFRLILLATILAVSSAGTAATFSGGNGAGVSIINAAGGADYTSLAEAAADFTSFPGGSTGNWTLQIASDLNETTQSVFGNNTNGFNVTVRPAPGTSVTVSFNYEGRPFDDPDASLPAYIWDGNIVIGPNRSFGGTEETESDPDTIRYMATHNFIIDGRNDPNGNERNLTLLTPEITSTRPLIPRYGVRVIGNCDDTVIRNTTIRQETFGTAVSGATEGYVGVLYTGRYVSSGALLFLPDRARVENCGISVMKNQVGRGVWSQITGPSSTGFNAITGMVITNNDIDSSHRLVQFGGNAGGEISYNRMRVVQEGPGQRVEAIIHTGSNGVTFPWTTNIIGNHIKEVVCRATNGFDYIIGIGGVPDGNTGVTFNIRNNMIGNVTGTADIAAGGNSILGRAIALQGGSRYANINIQHNSISMQNIQNYGNGADDNNNRMAALSFFNVGNYEGTMNFENNIVSYRQHNASLINTPTNGTVAGLLNFNNNTYHLANGAKFAEFNGVTYTLAEWQTLTSRDVNSNLVDPFSPPSGGKWIAENDLHFDAEPAAVFKTANVIAAITTDLDGQARPVAPVTKGADEFVPVSQVSDWVLY